MAFERARGVTVRERDLPATEDETIKGAYSPDLSTMVLGSASTAEDSDGLQTLVHESAHSILHDTRCMPVPTPDAEYLAGYDDSPEEIEANATALLVLQRLGVPLEIDDGTVISPKDWHVTEDALREQLDPLTARRVLWAADVLVRAAHEGAGAAPLAAGCPVRGPHR